MNILKKISLLLWVLLIPLFLISQNSDIPAKSDKLVNDYVGILKPDEKNNLENKLRAFNDTTSVQITIVIISDFKGYDKAEYATMIGTEWGVGQKGFDNGVVVLINPVGKEGKRDAYIAIGYGLEPIIPDATARRVFQNDMLPHFKVGEYYKGIEKAVNTLMSLASKEFTAEQYMKKTEKSPWIALVPFLALIIIFILIRKANHVAYSPGKKIPFWTALLLMSALGSGGKSSGNFSGGGSSGFGGFGGGSFGGGGAGGSW